MKIVKVGTYSDIANHVRDITPSQIARLQMLAKESGRGFGGLRRFREDRIALPTAYTLEGVMRVLMPGARLAIVIPEEGDTVVGEDTGKPKAGPSWEEGARQTA